jgi:hypothetical protein
MTDTEIMTDYIVISNDPFELQAEQQRTFTFELPGGLCIGISMARPILAYKVRPLSSPPFSARAELAIDVNEHEIARVQLAQDILCGLWETFPGHLLYANTTNTVQFRLLDGAVRLATAVLWFQRHTRTTRRFS